MKFVAYVDGIRTGVFSSRADADNAVKHIKTGSVFIKEEEC